MKLIDSIVASAPQIATVRRDLHAHPELCFEEDRTADVIAKQLEAWGIPVHRGLGKTSVVGILKNGSSARAVGLRADMDALPITERNTFAHASTIKGRMHACGHDGHVAMLLSAAQHLAQHRNFDGTVYLIFQPAEEGGGGAREMIRDGLFEKFPMDAVFGAHNWPGMKAGTVGIKSGPCYASSNEFKITIRGKGSHAAMPFLGFDPMPVAAQMVMAFQTIISRNKPHLEPGVLSVTKIHGGEATNVVPDQVVMEGTVRTFSTALLDLIERRMRTIAESTCAAFETSCEFEFERNYPPTVNHEAETAFARDVFIDVLGAANVLEFEPTMGAEDFSYFLQEKPGAYFMIGNGEGAHREAGHGLGPCMLHNPSYDFNDALIPIGGSLWVALAERWLAK
jgi:hippurate hydrolase